jgi:homogentisate solanesyltransferase
MLTSFIFLSILVSGVSFTTRHASSGAFTRSLGHLSMQKSSYAPWVKPAKPRPISPAKVFYKFSRPHTIKGTILASIMGVSRALLETPTQISGSLLRRAVIGLTALLCGNAYIVGINQIFDVKIDEINKPFLPIAAKQLGKKQAWALVMACFACGVSIVKTQFSSLIFGLYMLGTTLGTLYSIPPFHLKRFPLLAGGIIATVRGFLLNFGVYYAVREALGISFRWNPVVLFISSFMTVFASVIAITKVI